MNQIRKNRGLFVLMIASLFLIISFSIIWLIDQFNEEKFILHKELMHKYSDSHQQIIDSLLLKHIVIPAINDSSQHKVQVRIAASTIDNCDTISVEESLNIDGNKKKKEFIRFNLQSDGNREIKLDSAQIINFNNESEVLMRSVKLFVHQTSNVINDTLFNGNIFSETVDTTLFKEIFKDRVKEEGYSFDIRWIETDDNKVKKALFIENTIEVDNLPRAYISNYFFHIIKSILPQIVFVIFLISLTIIAFLLIYRNLLEQLRLNTLRDSFISNITHELKTPVSTVKIALEAISKYENNANSGSAKKYIEMANNEMDRLNNLVSKVLDHSVIENKSNLLNLENANLFELVDHLKKSFILQNDSLVIQNNVHTEIELIIDPLYIEGVVMNIIDNSIKYCNKSPVIQINSIEESNNIKLLVSDNGPGIPSEYRNKIFDKFFRISNSNVHDTKGYGLGLSFAKMVMQLHEGSIEFENNEVEGCTFTLTFQKTNL